LSIYLDHSATTPLAPQALAAITRSLAQSFANPSSRHRLGQAVRAEVEEARETVAAFIGARHSTEVRFTSGATDSIMRSFISACESGVEHLLVGATEHVAVLEAAEAVAGGRRVVQLPVNDTGGLVIEALEAELARGPAFVSVGLVNNETGVIADTERVVAACRRAGARLHFDAAQAVGRVGVDVAVLDCDYLSLSPHKFYGPKGCGVWFARSGSPIARAIGHDGTPNVAGIAGTAAAIAALGDWRQEMVRQGLLRDQLEAAILEALPSTAVNGVGGRRVANISNIYFPRRSAADLVEALSRRGVCVSAGAACTTGGRPSHVIEAMGFPSDRANGSVRFSLGRDTTTDDVNQAAGLAVEAYDATLPVGGDRVPTPALNATGTQPRSRRQ
jgi:cysteine desulfurase